MSGYQSLHDLIADKVRDAGSLTVADVDELTDAIYNVWMPAEAEAVNEAKRQAVKQRTQLVKTRTDLEQAQMTANAPDITSGA
jgi:hypothetical protein